MRNIYLNMLENGLTLAAAMLVATACQGESECNNSNSCYCRLVVADSGQTLVHATILARTAEDISIETLEEPYLGDVAVEPGSVLDGLKCIDYYVYKNDCGSLQVGQRGVFLVSVDQQQLLAFAMEKDGLILCEKNKDIAGINPADLIAALNSPNCLSFLEEKGFLDILTDCDDLGACGVGASAHGNLWPGLLGACAVLIRCSRSRRRRGPPEPA